MTKDSKLRKEDRIIDFLRFVGILKDLPRTGWVYMKVKKPETVSGHMYRMSLAAFALAGEAGVDTERCIRMALVHDLAEAKVGDITPSDSVTDAEKHRRELEAMKVVRDDLLTGLSGDPGREILELWMEYEEGKSKEAKFVKDLDKFDMVLQAVEYEAAGRVSPRGALDEFEYHNWQTPVVKQCAQQLAMLRGKLAMDTSEKGRAEAKMGDEEGVDGSESFCRLPLPPFPTSSSSSSSSFVFTASRETLSTPSSSPLRSPSPWMTFAVGIAGGIALSACWLQWKELSTKQEDR